MQSIAIKSDLDSFEESERASNKLKNRVYYVMDKMLDFKHNSYLIELVFLVIQTFQLIGIMDYSWMRNSQVTSSILNFMQSFLIVPFLISNTQVIMYQALFYLSFTFVLMLIMSFLSTSMLIVHNEQIKEKQKLSHKIIFTFMDFAVSAMTQVLYIPFFQLFCSTFRCERNTSNQFSATESQYKYYNTITKNECFSTTQIINLTLSIICLALLHGFIILFNKIHFEVRLECAQINSKISGQYDLNIQYFISTFSVASAFLFNDRYEVFRVIYSVAWWFHLLKMLNNNMIFNKKVFSFVKLEQAFILFWTSLIGVYNHFLPGSTIVVFFWIVGIIFLTVYNINYEPVNNDVCAANSFNFLYANDAMKQLRVLCYAIARYNKYSLKIDGFLNRHRNDCNLPSCPSRSNAVRIKKFNKMLANQTTNEDLIMSIFVIQTIFNSNILKFGGSNQIRLLYVLFLLETIQNKDQALIQLSFLELNSPSLQEEFTAYRLKKIIMQIQNHKDFKSKIKHILLSENLFIQLLEMVDFSLEFTSDEYSNKFLKILNASIQNLLQFYQEMLEVKPQAHVLLKKGNQFVDYIDQIKNQFDYLVQQGHLSQSAYRIFQSFSLNILEDKECFGVLQKQIHDQNDLKVKGEETKMKDEDTYTQGVILISSQEENFASILEVNLEMLKIIGFTKSQVLSKDISILIPNIWQQYHNQFIDQFLATGEKKIIGQNRDLFLKSKQNYCLPVQLNIKIIPSHTQGLLFQAQVVAKNLLYEYPAFFITNLNGQIETISPSAITLFNLDMKKIKQGMLIEKIIPNFWEYILEFQQKEGKQLIIKTYQQKMMRDSYVQINLEQIIFMNLCSQGYIITIKLSKYDINCLPTLNQECKIEQQQINKTQTKPYSQKDYNLSVYDEIKQDILQEKCFQQDQQRFLINSSNSQIVQKKKREIEIFYDMRTHTYQGVVIDMPYQNNQQESEKNDYTKMERKSILNQISSNSNFLQSISNNIRSCNKQALMYPFIYSSVRSNESRIQDILDNTKNKKQNNESVNTEVQKILENLINLQLNRRNQKFQPKQHQKPTQVYMNNEDILPSLYLKSHELQKAQLEYMNQIECLILKAQQKQEKAEFQNETNNQIFKKNFGQDIKTMRLQINNIIDLNQIDESEDRNSQKSNQNIENNQEIQQLENQAGEYERELDEKCGDTITRFQMYNVTHLFFANTQHIVEGVFNMFAIDKGVYYNHDNLDYSTAEFYFQQYLELETIYQFGLDEILTKLYLNKVGVTQEMEDLFVNDRNINILIHFIHLQTSVYPNNLYQASQQVLAKVYHYKRLPLGQFDYHNNDIYINVENLSNQILNQIIQYRDLQEQEIFNYLHSVSVYTEDILSIGLIFILCYIVLASILYHKNLHCYYEIPSILTTIPLSQIRNQIKIYEKFLKSSLTLEEDDYNQLNQINEQINQDQTNKFDDFNDQKNQDKKQNSKTQEEPNSPLKAKSSQHNYFKKSNIVKSKNKQNIVQNLENSINTEQIFSLRGITSQNVRPINYSIFNAKLIIPFFFSLIFFSVFMIVDTILTQNFTNLLKQFYQELTYSVKLEPEFMLLFNCLKSQTQANNYIGVRQVYEPIVYFKLNINLMYQLMDNLTYTHYNNKNILPVSYQQQFDQYFSKNPQICNQLYKKNPLYVNQTECINYMYGQLNEGMSVNINHLITKMITYSQSIAQGNIVLPYKHSVNQEMYQAQLIINYLKHIMRELNDLFINSIQQLSQTLYIIRIAVSISISSLLFSIFLFFSIPIIQQIKSQIFNQRQLFSIIPIHLLSKNRYIRQYILKQYLSNNKK